MKSLMAISHGTVDPASRFRVVQYLPFLERAGWRVSHRPKRPDREGERKGSLGKLLLSPLRKWQRSWHRRRDIRDASHFDVVFQNRDLLGGKLHWDQRLIRQNPRFVFDFDDAIFLGGNRARHVEWICRHAAWVTAGNEELAAFAKRVTPNVTVLPTTVATSDYAVRDYEAVRTGRFRLGWVGSGHSIRETLFPYVEMLVRLQRELDFDFVIMSNPKPVLPDFGLRWTFVTWTPVRETRLADFMDAGIMPLVENAFQRGKCGLKLLQYMAAALPVIASPVGINRNLVPGHGFLVDSEDEWREAIRSLMKNPLLSGQLGTAGRAFCQTHYDLRRWADVLIRLFEDVSEP